MVARGKEARGWTSDHARAGSKSSMGVLLDWLTAPGNYERWRAPASNKAALSSEITQLLRAAGISHRRPKDVYKKIYDMEKAFFRAADKLRSDRAQLLASKGSATGRRLHRSLLLQSRYFLLLQPVMGESTTTEKRPKKRPLLSTRRTPPPTPTRPSQTPPPKRSRKPAVARRVTPPRACNTRQPSSNRSSKRECRTSPKRLRFHGEDETEELSARTTQAEGVIKTQVPGDKDSKAALGTEIETERAQLDLAMRRLEVQAARDKALIARVKARGELVEYGISLRDVDRLLPLDL